MMGNGWVVGVDPDFLSMDTTPLSSGGTHLEHATGSPTPADFGTCLDAQQALFAWPGPNKLGGTQP